MINFKITVYLWDQNESSSSLGLEFSRARVLSFLWILVVFQKLLWVEFSSKLVTVRNDIQLTRDNEESQQKVAQQ
jgi:hypothetical protein